MGQHQAAQYVLELSATAVEARQRIMKATAGPRFRYVPGSFVSFQRGDNLYVGWSNPYLQNSFKPFLKTQLEATSYGSRLAGRFQVHPFIRVVVAIFYGVFAFIVVSVVTQTDPAKVGSVLANALLLPVVGTVFWWLLWRAGRSERKHIVQFLEELFQDDRYMPEVTDADIVASPIS